MIDGLPARRCCEKALPWATVLEALKGDAGLVETVKAAAGAIVTVFTATRNRRCSRERTEGGG